MKKLIIIFLSWLLIVNVFALVALNRFNMESDTAYIWISPDQFSQQQDWNLISLHARWDSFWYLDIVEKGYSFQGPEQLSNVVFFPLYPLLIKAVSFLVGGNLMLAGWLVSALFLFLALFYFHKLVEEFHPKINPYLPVLLLLIFPTAFFLNTVYTESLFLFLSLATFYYGLKQRFPEAGMFGLFASLTRVTGILLLLPLVWEYLKSHNFRLSQLFRKKALPLLLIPAGTLSFFFYHYLRFGDILLFFKVQSGGWGRSFFHFDKNTFLLFSHSAIVNFFIDVVFVVLAFGATYFVFKRLRTSYGIYMLATTFIALSTGTLMSIGRYILVLFPIYIFVASLKNRFLQQPWIFASILFLALNVILFVNNYWAG